MKRIFIFSELSKRTLYTIESIRAEKDDSNIIILAKDVASKELSDTAGRLGCSLHNTDIENLDLSGYDADNTQFTFMFLDEFGGVNFGQSINIIERYSGKYNLEIYSVAQEKHCEVIYDSILRNYTGDKLLKIRRVFPERNMIYHNLCQNMLFDYAKEVNGEKVITVICVGMDSVGMEMVKACLWCAQMDGYILKMIVIDEDDLAEERFYYDAPDVKSRNALPRSGEDYYEITFHTGITIETKTFVDLIKDIKNPSWVLVSLGDDGTNISTAIKIREICSQVQLYNQHIPPHYPTSQQVPFIQAVVRDPYTADILNKNLLVNFKGQYYNIQAIGDEKTNFSIEYIENRELEEIALKTHMVWGDKESFENHEYNRRASIASAIHKVYMGQYYPDDTKLMDIMEHRRWCAYVRGTEGYIFGLIRDDLAKQHNCLVKFDDLSQKEKSKDTAANKAQLDGKQKKD